MKVLITGASGYIGGLLTSQLIAEGKSDTFILATDIRRNKELQVSDKLTFLEADLREDHVSNLIMEQRPDVVVHLAAIVSPSKGMTREFIYDVEVNGTKKILDACISAGVRKFITTSSGAAYGYHADNPEWLKESDPLRGNQEFAYSWHKRLIEEMLAMARKDHPGLKQVIFRVSTILGDHTKNDITNLFDKDRIMGLNGTDTPFVIIWDKDLVRILTKAVLEDKEGIFNVAGDGIITLKEIAGILGKKYISLPPALVKAALTIANPLGISRYGPEQVKFIQYRPVLDNSALKAEFGYIPEKTSRDVFMYYAEKNGLI